MSLSYRIGVASMKGCLHTATAIYLSQLMGYMGLSFVVTIAPCEHIYILKLLFCRNKKYFSRNCTVSFTPYNCDCDCDDFFCIAIEISVYINPLRYQLRCCCHNCVMLTIILNPIQTIRFNKNIAIVIVLCEGDLRFRSH